jgi:CO/xanthine dehydrogenase FAD-binding subunit
MDGFGYEKPTTVAQAAALLAGAQGRARVLAGGTDLLVAIRSGLSQPELVVDVKRIPEMTAISWTADGELVIGAAVEVERIAEDARIGEVFPALAQGAGAIGSLQVRNRATIGGNLANASPCMDTAPPLLVLRAHVRVASQAGERRIPLPDLFVGVKRTALAPEEIVTAVVVPKPTAGLRSAFEKIKRVFGHDLALVNAAGAYDPGARTLRVAIGSCGVTPVLLPPLGNIDQTADVEEVGRRLAAAALKSICPIDDVRASAEYRLEMAALLCRRLAAALLGEHAGRR